jgi:rubredoxin
VVTSLTPCYGSWLQTLCNHPQHAGLPTNTNDFRLSCRTNYLHPALEFLYWHMNYHLEHHMYAAVPCYKLEKLHQAIRSDLPPTLKGLLPVWRQIIAIQHRQKSEPDYACIPEIPVRPGLVTESSPTALRPDSVAADQSSKTAIPDNTPGRIWQCMICGFVYSELKGLPGEGIPAGTAWEDVPDDWLCPDCGTPKADFEMREQR